MVNSFLPIVSRFHWMTILEFHKTIFPTLHISGSSSSESGIEMSGKEQPKQTKFERNEIEMYEQTERMCVCVLWLQNAIFENTKRLAFTQPTSQPSIPPDRIDRSFQLSSHQRCNRSGNIPDCFSYLFFSTDLSTVSLLLLPPPLFSWVQSVHFRCGLTISKNSGFISLTKN